MKLFYTFIGIVLFFTVTSCSKKGDATPMAHTIKVTAGGTAQFTAIVSVIRSNETVSTALDNKTVAAGSYDYSTSLNSGDVVHLEIQTMGENTVNYTITDNAAIGVQISGKELGSFSKATADYTVN